MADPKPIAALIGCTGLVGSHILQTLLSHPPIQIHTLSRRALPTTTTSTNLTPHLEKDSSAWPSLLTNIHPAPTILFSALGTTRAQAGSLAAQRAIDHDLNLSLARAALSSGVKIYVLISSGAASPTSSFPYLKMKGELEDAVSKLGFPHCVILRPGLLVGRREESRWPEAVMRGVANGLGAVSGGHLKDFWAQDADVVGRAAVAAGWECLEGKREGKGGVWWVEQSEIMALGRGGEANA